MTYVQESLSWFNTYQGAISAIATVVLTMTTMVYAWHTAVLARENRLLRQAGMEPEIVAYLSPHPRFTGGLLFILANVGRGPALDVSFRITKGGDDFDVHEARLRTPPIPLTVIPQGDRYDTFFGMVWQAFREPRLRPFSVEVKFFDLNKRKRTKTYVLDVTQFDGRITLDDQPEEEIAKAVKDIASEMQNWTRRNLPVETIAQDERIRRDHERLKKFKNEHT